MPLDTPRFHSLDRWGRFVAPERDHFVDADDMLGVPLPPRFAALRACFSTKNEETPGLITGRKPGEEEPGDCKPDHTRKRKARRMGGPGGYAWAASRSSASCSIDLISV